MITFKNHPITTLVGAALQHEALDEFAGSVVAGLASSNGLTNEQKLGVQLVTDTLVRSGKSIVEILDYVMTGDFNGAVEVAALSAEQREGIIMAIVTQAQSVLSTKATELTTLATASYTIPSEEEE